MGWFDRIKMKGQLKEAEMQSQLAQYKLATTNLQEAQKFALPDSDETDWIMTGSDGHLTDVYSAGYDHYSMLEKCYNLWVKNLFARAIIRNLCKFILGKGPIIKAQSENKLVQQAWDDFVKLNKWHLREKEMVKRVFRDGELFIRKFQDTATANIKLRFIRANLIRNSKNTTDINSGENVTFGIGTSKEDIEDVKTYYLCDAQNNLVEKIPASEIIHIKILTDSDVKRGMSFLLVAMSMLKKYNDWLDDRIVLNKVRTAIVLIRKVTGTSSTVDNIRNQGVSERFSADKYKQKAFEKGTVITASKGIEYEMLSPNINAADVKDDGRTMLLAVAAGVGFPEQMLTADYSNANYSSSITAQNPFVREIEDWQDFFQFYYEEIFADAVKAGKLNGKIPNTEPEGCIIEWPPLILANIVQNNQAREVQHRNKIISKTTWQQKEGLDPDLEKQNLETEAGEDIYKNPLAVPAIAPINQYGSTEE